MIAIPFKNRSLQDEHEVNVTHELRTLHAFGDSASQPRSDPY